MAYFCVASNTRWGLENPDESYGIPADGHIPLTLDYLDFLGNSIQDALLKTEIDGFIVQARKH